jgi:hypothetical protein
MEQKGREYRKLCDVGSQDLYFLRVVFFAVKLEETKTSICIWGVGLKTQTLVSDTSIVKTKKQIV